MPPGVQRSDQTQQFYVQEPRNIRLISVKDCRCPVLVRDADDSPSDFVQFYFAGGGGGSTRMHDREGGYILLSPQTVVLSCRVQRVSWVFCQ